MKAAHYVVCPPTIDASPTDAHRFIVRVGEYGADLQVSCPYAAEDETRPCWPHAEDENGEYTVPMPAPQSGCTYDEWCANTTMDETLHGEKDLALGPVEVRWEDGQMHLTLPVESPKGQK